MKTIISNSENITSALASDLAEKAKTPHIYCLYGDLGAGKTVFAKGFAAGLGLERKKIKSPTFNLIRKYGIGAITLFHCDFYRIVEPDDIIANELNEIFHNEKAIVLIEWPERIKKLLPQNTTDIYFEYKDENTRIIKIDK